jgi:hypothetical protein
MDQQTNQQEPSGTEGGQVKVGDKVWVLCEVVSLYSPESLYMDVHYDGLEIQAKRSDCRPVEPPTKEPTRGQKLAERTMKAIWAANNAVNGTPAIKEPLATKSNSPEIPDSSSDPINPSHYKQGGIECIEAMKVALGGGFFGYLRGNAIKYLWRYDKKNGVEDLKKARWYLDRLIKEVGE